MGFGVLALIMACTLLGPALAGMPRMAPPLVVGELLAGVLVGDTGFRILDTADPNLKFLSDIGFALLMFSMGAGLPLRAPGVRSALRKSSVATALSIVIAIPVAYGIAAVTDHITTGMVIILVACCSAALALPSLTERRLQQLPEGLAAATWTSVANVVTVMMIPVLIATGSVWKASLGGLGVLAASVGVFYIWKDARAHDWARRYRRMSKRRRWGLDLRVALVALFLLCWLALKVGSTVLVAGFSAGAVLALVGQPRRLARQVLGLGEGFFVPLFFVVLGAQLDLRGFASQPNAILLGVLLLAGATLVHVLAGVGAGLPVPVGLVATAQMGVPAAVVSTGFHQHLITSTQGAAILAAALGSVAVMSLGTKQLVARRDQVAAAAAAAAAAAKTATAPEEAPAAP